MRRFPRSVADLIESEEKLAAENRDLQKEIEALREWRASVTVALRRPGGSFFADVPGHIRELVREVESLRALLDGGDAPARVCRVCKSPRLADLGDGVFQCADCAEVHDERTS